MLQSKILIVQGYNSSTKILCNTLLKNSYKCICKYSFKNIIDTYKKEKPKLVILDIILEENYNRGLNLAQKLVKIDKTPIIFLTDLNPTKEIRDKINKISTKAIYLTKPLNSDLILINLQMLLNDKSNIISKVGKDCYFNLTNLILYINNKPQPLNKRETNLIKLFLENQNKVVTYNQLNFVIFELENHDKNDGQLRNFIYRFKSKFKCFNIITTPKVGYTLIL